MSKKHRKKPKLSPAGWSWLAQNVGTDGWDRILDLREISLEAVFAFVKSQLAPEHYRQFEELNLPPDVLAERRTAEAARIKAEEDEKRRIYPGTPQTAGMLHGDILALRPRFKALGILEAERAAKAAKEKADGEALYIIEEPYFDPLP